MVFIEVGPVVAIRAVDAVYKPLEVLNVSAYL